MIVCAYRQRVSCGVCTALRCGLVLMLTWSNGLMGILPEWQSWGFISLSFPQQTQAKIRCTSAACLREQNKQKHMHTWCSFIKMWEVVLKKRWTCLTVMCVTQISAELSDSNCCSRPLCFYEFIRKGAVFKCMLQKQSDLYVWKEMKSFSVPLCLSLLSSLCSAFPRSCSFSLLSENQTCSLHRSACHPVFIQPKTASICTFLLQTPSCLSI